jgi:HEAT repeat protein
MSEKISELLIELDSAETRDQINQIVDRIAKFGELAVPELIQYVKQSTSGHGAKVSVIRILQKMGYPANRPALQFMVGQASNINSSGWEIVLSALVDIGEPVIPEVRDAVRFYSLNINNYSIEIQGLATLLELMGSPRIDPLLPELLFLLESGTDENEVDLYALWPLRKIGSPKADIALDQIAKIISSHRSTTTRKAAIDTFIYFDLSAVRPFVHILKDCLSDDEKTIRESAVKILNALGAD